MSEQEKVINTRFYDGTSVFNKKKESSEATQIICSAYDKCELYAKGRCVCRGLNLFSWDNCKFGKAKTISGPTRRAKSFGTFQRVYKESDTYEKVKAPEDQKIFRVSGYIGVKLKYVGYDDEKNCLTDPTFTSGNWEFIEEENFNNDFIHHVCTFESRAMMGGIIKSYQKEAVPEFLYQLKTYLPDIYNRFVQEYPEFSVKEVNYVGKKAYVKTLRKGCVIKGFTFDGEYLYNPNYHITFFFIDNAQTEVKVKVTDDMVVEITDNSQVDENTMFV